MQPMSIKLLRKIPSNERRNAAQLRQHYEVERELADRLRCSAQDERLHLYRAVYDKLFKRVPAHPQLTRKQNAGFRQDVVSDQMNLLGHYLKSNIAFMEIGAGDCSLSLYVANIVKNVIAVDVSTEITNKLNPPDNFELLISDGCSIDVPAQSVDVAYSYQLMEHLHPDDAVQQLRHICNALKPGGIYICITPNRLTGPHDISKYFDQDASGFHLKEYTISELSALFLRSGFSKARLALCTKGLVLELPILAVKWFEHPLALMPYAVRYRLSMSRIMNLLLGISLVATR